MKNEELETIIDYLCDIESLICTIRDSCEFHLYTAQQGALDIACKYIGELQEYISHLF